MKIDFRQLNEELDGLAPRKIIRWAIDSSEGSVIVSTNFGPHEAAILHMCVRENPEIKVVWVDTGFNTQNTYQFAKKLIERLSLKMEIYTPRVTRAYREAVLGGVPDLEDGIAHREFTDEVKLEPFRRALEELNPAIWLTALRREQTPFRETLNTVMRASFGGLKVCPLLHWSVTEVEKYLARHGLPIEKDYHDPTKVLDRRECGLHPELF